MPVDYLADATETEHVEINGTRFAFRRFGPRGDVPLVLFMRFRGTIDHWDPAVLDVLARERDVIVFDNRGIGFSGGTTPDSVAGFGEGAIEFIEALGLTRVDLLGWSMGGYVAQAVALSRPDLVRRLVVVGSGPGGKVPGQPASPDKVWQVAGKPVNDDEDFLYLFFPETDEGRELGLASLCRTDQRLLKSHAEVSPEAVKAQMTAIGTFTGFYDRLPEITTPVLAVNGAHDVMINAFATFAMSQRLPDAKVIFYTDAGHGVLFQHPDEFGKDVLDFLR
ncbi:alpha/beta hydrolase [Planotetraspora thailandica]|uniref:Alpha/beta hydrolase n=1 Tax=Planotetraspora thailandica TaxID=487172 RepID=A0A8J3V163_9ACTN|nr:alpha/beta hydrolase [Planotetraspora thailandica]GII54340.1 alpha/beta hydrolase [Planotetraspora thailandica]